MCAVLGWLPMIARPKVLVAQASSAVPQGEPPDEPPPSTTSPPPPPVEEEQPSPATAAPAGQWVYTQQYGWIWMVYGDNYNYAPPNGEGEPLAYVYYPRLGWEWVAAPWVWGVGPWPFFGTRGPAHFVWYTHGWWRHPSRWHYRPSPIHGGVASRGIRPPPPRHEHGFDGHHEHDRGHDHDRDRR